MSETLEELVECMCDGADPRRQRSLRAVHGACEEHRAHGSRDYSLATIGRLSQARGGPAERALRNKSGAQYRQVIAAHQAAYALPAKPKRSKADEDGLLDGVRDPLQRARIELLRDEVKGLRRKVQMLQQIAAASAVVTLVPSRDGDASLPAAHLGRQLTVDLLPTEKEALRDGLEETRLTAAGLRIDRLGRIHDANGTELFPMGFADALVKLSKAFGAEPRTFGYGGIGDVTTASS
jgi:hypothetical protein